MQSYSRVPVDRLSFDYSINEQKEIFLEDPMRQVVTRVLQALKGKVMVIKPLGALDRKSIDRLCELIEERKLRQKQQ